MKKQKCDHSKLVETTVNLSLLGVVNMGLLALGRYGPMLCAGCGETVPFTWGFYARVVRRLAERRSDLEEPIKHLLEGKAEKPQGG